MQAEEYDVEYTTINYKLRHIQCTHYKTKLYTGSSKACTNSIENAKGSINVHIH